MKLIRVLHPGINPKRYLISIETATVFSLSTNRLMQLRKPLWLFSSLYWPLPPGWLVRVIDTHLHVFKSRKATACQRIFTEKIIAVQRPVMLVSMFLGKERSTTELLNLFTEQLTVACCYQTVPT